MPKTAEAVENPVKMIISGGQSGADLAGNEFARSRGIATRCYTFESFKPANPADEPVLDSFEKVLIKTESNDYVRCLRDRTLFNVKRADATVIFINRPIHELGTFFSGSRLTWKCCEAVGKPYALAYVGDWDDAVEAICKLIRTAKPTILNVAGQRLLERKIVRDLLRDAWKQLAGKRVA